MPKRQAITMTDLARIGGYSRLTVSLALGNRPGVAEDTRQRILALAEAHGYTPNLLAGVLKGKPSNLIGVVVRDIANPYYSAIIQGIESITAPAGYTLLNLSTHEDHAREVRALRTLAAYQVDGVLLAPILRGVDFSHVARYGRERKPLITFERIPELGFDYVDFEDEEGALLATDYLARMGHQNLAYIAGPATSKSSEERLAGFKKGLARHKIPFSKSLCAPGGSSAQDGYRAALELLRVPGRRPTAIFAFSDLVAIGVYKAAQELGLRIPRDLSVVGYDDVELASVLGPSLTTIGFSIGDVGRFVAERMLEAIRSGKQKTGLAQRFTPRLIERGSVRRLH